MFEDIVNVSSSDTDEALELLTLASGHSYSSQVALNNSQVASSESSTGSEWFEDWPEANDVAASIYVALTTDPLPSHLERGGASHRPRGRSRARNNEVASASGDQQPAERKSVGRKLRDQSSASRKPHDRKCSPVKPPIRMSAASGSRNRKSTEAKKLLADSNSEAPLLPHDVEDSFQRGYYSPWIKLDRSEWEIIYRACECVVLYFIVVMGVSCAVLTTLLSAPSCTSCF
jgi:hypothetical protein